jgi:hypothetical protein
VNRRALAPVAGLLLLLPVAGCSSDAPPAEAVPELAAQLDRVDAAVAAGDYARARAAVDALVARTAQAEVADEITEEEADRIFDAARDVLAELPPADEGASTPPPTEDTEPPAEAPAGEGDGDAEGDDKPGKGEEKKEEKEEKEKDDKDD